MARGMHVRPCLVNLGMDRKSRSVDGLFADHDLAVFVHEDEVTHADLREVSGQWVEPCGESVVCRLTVMHVEIYKSGRSRWDRGRLYAQRRLRQTHALRRLYRRQLGAVYGTDVPPQVSQTWGMIGL